MGQDNKNRPGGVAWPTLGLIVICYGAWFAALWFSPIVLAIPLLAIIIALHASLQHEVIHGHPFRWQWLNDALIWPPLMLIVPYARFKATHLAHHNDATLTDPYDDPETNFLDPGTWERLPSAVQMILTWNNTLAGRLILGPAIGTIMFMLGEWRMRDAAVTRGWALHIPALIVTLWVILVAPIPVWAYFIAAYFAMSLLKLRTFLEHQAHERASGRSVIIEDRGPFAFLFLNNNLHVVHHMHPGVAWYDLPALYQSRKDHYQRRNGGYVYRSYTEVFARYLWHRKDPVAHPLWRR
ncbi:fatty acid desaturase [Cognatiyoonia sp. IB215446]|uniref:fatty acid desaturase n=1 Tax=Cognatiyoonia sp. IB215446 TaxID=3097355 RepID=UPI002A139774|nr:fatty acid desaturase [Cognatiyoonia sp. IB215446]MDX8348039.1 fatty acid desaturase [Cognatiyoonia sp. IB215446]